MKAPNKRFSHDSLQDAKSIRTLIGALSKGFAKGEITLSDEDGQLALKTDGLMNLRIKAERTDGVAEVSLRVRWADPEHKQDKKGAPKID